MTEFAIGDKVKRNEIFAIFEHDIAPVDIDLNTMYTITMLGKKRYGDMYFSDTIEVAMTECGIIAQHLIEIAE